MEGLKDKKEKIPRVLIFGGTTESQTVLGFLQGFDLDIILSVATEYGRDIAVKNDRVKVVCGRMGQEEMSALIREDSVDLVIDATHPFAAEVTANIRCACGKIPVEYIRCLREEMKEPKEMPAETIYVASVKEAADYLRSTQGNILITTGSKELRRFCEIPAYRTRCYVRVLSVPDSVRSAAECGFAGRNLIAMQAPFSKEMNIATIHYAKARFFVTKETGDAGGMKEKIQACSETGTTMIVVRHPRESGRTPDEVCEELNRRFQIYRRNLRTGIE